MVQLLRNYFYSSDFCTVNNNEAKEYSRSQLALRNGQDRDDIWCAFDGVIYDLTNSKMWRNGKHYEHWAGQDLSDEMSDAPHNEKVFSKFQIVGILKKD